MVGKERGDIVDWRVLGNGAGPRETGETMRPVHRRIEAERWVESVKPNTASVGRRPLKRRVPKQLIAPVDEFVTSLARCLVRQRAPASGSCIVRPHRGLAPGSTAEATAPAGE